MAEVNTSTKKGGTSENKNPRGRVFFCYMAGDTDTSRSGLSDNVGCARLR